MAGENSKYAYGFCEEFANTLPDWEWVKSKRGYRNQIFKNTHLYIGPGKLTFGGGFSVSTVHAYVMIYNRYFSKVSKLATGHSRFLYRYDIGLYYQKTKNISIKEQPNYAHMVPEMTPFYKSSSVPYQLLSAFPEVLHHVFERGKAILDEHLDYSSEIALLHSALVPRAEVVFYDQLYKQSILRLMLNQDHREHLEAYRETYPNSPNAKALVNGIEQHADEIRRNSPYC